MAAALFSTTQHKVLHLLFSNPDRSFFGGELIELAGSGSGAVQREIARLVESGLVTQKAIGRQRHYQANHGSPIFQELRSIVVKTSGFADAVRQALQPLGDRVVLAMLYGSMVKGVAKSHSDIDLLVVAEGLLLEDLYFALESTEKSLGRRINPTLYSVQEFVRRRTDKNPFLTKVLDGKTQTLIGNLNEIKAARQPGAHRKAQG